MKNACSLPAFQTQFKVSVIGAGNVGATAAYAMLMDGTPSELVIMDHHKEKAEGLMLDMEHSMAFLNATKIVGTDDVKACKNSQLIVVTAGARQQEGETRLDLIKKNRAIFKELIPALAKVAPKAILLIVSNPVDVLTMEADSRAASIVSGCADYGSCSTIQISMGQSVWFGHDFRYRATSVSSF